MTDWPLCRCGCGRPVTAHAINKTPTNFASEECRREHKRAYSRRHYQQRKAKESAEKRRQRWREAKARQWARPEKRRELIERTKAARRKNRKAYNRKRARRVRERRAWLKAHDPEGYERLLARERANEERMRADPKRYRRRLEAQRLWEALQRNPETFGTRRPRGKVFIDSEEMGRLDAQPLVAHIGRLVARRTAELNGHAEHLPVAEIVCESIGITERTYRRWLTGEAASVRFDTADRILQNSDALWFEVFDADRWPEAHRRAAELFEGA